MISMVLEGYSGYTKGEAGSGLGKLAGWALAGAPGAFAGHYIGKYSVNKPNDSIDEKSKLDRVGAISDESMKLKRLAKYGGIGAGLGASGVALYNLIKNGEIDGDTATRGLIGGGLLGAAGGVLKGGYEAGKKLGYGPLGKIGSAITPLTGVTVPDKLRNK